MSKAFGFNLSAIGSSMVDQLGQTAGRQIVGKTSAAVSGAIDRVLDKVNGKIGKALGRVFGSEFTDIDPRSWLARAQNRADPHFQIDWTIELPDGFDAAYVEEVSAPVADYESSSGVFRGGLHQFYADIQSVSPLNITFYEDQNFTSSKYLTQWRNRIASNGLYNYPAEYKRNIRVIAHDVGGNCIAMFVYEGCWPSKIPNYTLQSAATGRTTIAIDFNVDGMYMTFPGASVDLFGFGKIVDFVSGFPTRITGAISGGIGNVIGRAIGRL